ncbi:MAG TPA: dephospho-CoA kinase [Verrucomicrobiae bacterium]|nr:dephospho-CoA kinase [Verrucomicrobiae bacterium]
MRVIGLTGSIGMGKSTAAAALRRLGIPVHDADAVVHRLLRSDRETIAAVEAEFPGVTGPGGVDRPALGAKVFNDPAALRRLEALIHPRVRRSEIAFLRRARAAHRSIAVLDIPLLFETGGEARCDATMVVAAPRFLQEQRVLARPGMTRERLAAIRQRQSSDEEKLRRADMVIPTGLDRRTALRILKRALAVVRVSAPPHRGLRRVLR